MRANIIRKLKGKKVESWNMRFQRDGSCGTWGVVVADPFSGHRRWIDLEKFTKQEAMNMVTKYGVDELIESDDLRLRGRQGADALTGKRDRTCRTVLNSWKEEIHMRFRPAVAMMAVATVELFLDSTKMWKRPVSHIRAGHVFSFANTDGDKLKTRMNKRSAVQNFIDYAISCGFASTNPATNVRIKTEEMSQDDLISRPAAPFTREEYDKVMNCPTRVIPEDWKLITALAYWTGLRLSDCARLEHSALTAEPGYIVVKPKKAGKSGTTVRLPLINPLIGTPEFMVILERLRNRNWDQDIPSYAAYVFPNIFMRYSFNEKSGSVLSIVFRRMMDRIYVGGKTFHSLRHAFRDRMIRGGMTLDEVAKLMGHRSIITTAKYGAERTIMIQAAGLPLTVVPPPKEPIDSELDEGQLTG